MFKRKNKSFKVMPIGSVIMMDNRYYRVENYGLVELPKPQELPKEEK